MKWSASDFDGATTVSAATREFLSTYGLPESIPYTTFEFGPHDSVFAELVIGCDFDYPIIVAADDCVTTVNDTATYFFNSNVRLLSSTIDQWLQMRNDFDETHPGRAIGAFKSFLLLHDPSALSDDFSVWRTMIEDFESLCT